MSDKLPATADRSYPLNHRLNPADAKQTDVYAIQARTLSAGVCDGEVLALVAEHEGVALRDQLTAAEEFLNTFYFQYGHRSIADLAHIRLPSSDCRCWPPSRWWTSSAGRQERSTRYQNFRKSGWFAPALGERTAGYTASIERCLRLMTALRGMLEALKRAIRSPRR